MNTKQLIQQIHADLHAAIDPVYKEGATRYFKEQVKLYGVRTPNVRKVATNYATLLKKEPLPDVWRISEQLLQTGYMEDATIAISLVYARKKEWTASDFNTLTHWLHTYVSNWAICDDLCNHAIGYCIETYPEILTTIHSWTQSDNRWVRRAAAVSFIIPARRGTNLADVLHVARLLLYDTDDLVQKGCGWMLKEAAKKHQPEIVTYIEKYKKTMPRTMLRYAIELMPANIKKQLMNQ
ncbi:DNA alkylation repair protein [Methylicorpusculum sp.]|uniref:DNA alkylation repair protein n=1 Tax=Methylicorpusculum sp. TaxID=2713644 RepID=UPI002AB940AE|nr:DNA alkylation repair protein [Methylicorpusculum sp.]MDZ4153875.1 DNA alkylation repair protein [Methylicorpusculum sp.]